jgi:pimeloyl-ACP methyl ester carboxylesterase
MFVTLDDGADTMLQNWGTVGPVLLCVHGMSGSRMSWQRLANRYSDRYRVVAYDQRGHGDSVGVHGPMTLARGVRDLHNVLEAIDGADVLIGHSWGGAIVIRGGEKADVRGVVAIDPMIVQTPAEWYDEFIDELDEQFALTGAAREAAIREQFGDWHADDLAGKVHAAQAMSTAPIRALRDENPPEVWDLREDIAAYGKPLLLAMAERVSSIVPPAIMDDVEGHRSPEVRIQTFEGAGHSLHRTDFDAFAAALDEFLKDIHLSR